MSSVALVKQEINNIIKRFKFEELEMSVMPTFPEVSLTNIKSKLVKHHQNFTSANAAQFINIAITKANLEEKVLRDRLSMLQLIDICWHNKRRTWYGYAFVGLNKSVNYFMFKKIQSSIQDYFQSKNMKMDVKVNIHDGITYVSLIERRSKNTKRRRGMLPVVFALFIGQKYFFCTKKSVSSNILEAIIENMGYEGSKRLQLTGRDLKSLSRLCWKNKEGALNYEYINKPLIYKDGSPERKSTGVDFTQHKKRRKFAEKCFGVDPPTLELLVINGPSTPVIHKEVSMKLSNESLRATWEFRSRNIALFLTKLIERRILVTPVPYYISNLMVLGKNEFTLENN